MTLIKLKVPFKKVLINLDQISSIDYLENYLTITMKNGSLYRITDKKQIDNLLQFLNPNVIEV